jgi:hypothetical protein
MRDIMQGGASKKGDSKQADAKKGDSKQGEPSGEMPTFGFRRPGGGEGGQRGEGGEGRQRGEGGEGRRQRGEGGMGGGFGAMNAQLAATQKDLDNAKLPAPPGEETNLDVLLRPGLLADVEIIVEKVPNAVYIPNQAVFESADGKTVVYVKNQDRFEPRPIQVAKRSESLTIVAGGVKPGDTISLSDPTAKPGAKKKSQESKGGGAAGALPPMGGGGGAR